MCRFRKRAWRWGKKAWRWRKRTWRGAIVKVARGNTTGSQDHHSLIRLMTALELIQNRQYYDTKKKHNDFLNDTRIVTSTYDKLVRDALTDRCYSEMAHIYALSAALGITVHSHYPPQLNSELSNAFNRNVRGRKVADSESKLSVMWTSASVPRTP